MRPLSIGLIALPLTLAACQGETKKTGADETRTAQGEVLPGSASDAMLPLDTVRSQPPLAPIEETTAKAGKSKGGKAATDAADAEDDAAPGASPSSAPSSAPRIDAQAAD